MAERNRPDLPESQGEPHPIGALAVMVVVVLIIISLWVSVYSILLQRAGS